MKWFAYQAADRAGQVAKGTVSATEIHAARAQLAEASLFPLAIRPAPGPRPWHRTPRRDLATMLGSLAGMVEIGIPLDQAVKTTADLLGGQLSRQLLEARQLLREGAPLTAALAGAGCTVPVAVAGVLRAGEQGGQLAASLRRAAESLEREAELSGRLQQALAYPMLLMVTGLASLILIIGVVVPKFSVMLADMGTEPPWAARSLFAGSAALRAHPWVAIGIVVLGLASLLVAVTRDEVVLRLPMIGTLAQQLATSRLANALSGMLSTGVPLLTALKTAAPAIGRPELAHRLDRARERTAHGERFAAALEAEQVIWPPALRLIAIGEANGRLAEMVQKAGTMAQTEAERRIRILTSLLEPLLIVGFALVIGFVAAALLQAVYSLRPGGN